jgi:hypothetical protein
MADYSYDSEDNQTNQDIERGKQINIPVEDNSNLLASTNENGFNVTNLEQS